MSIPEETILTEEIRVRGIVQGVGFRPTVYRLAKACRLRGEVCNDGQGVLITVKASSETLDEFVQRLLSESPPLAKIESITRTAYRSDRQFADFRISDSVSNAVRTEIAPDAATCPQCREETFNPLSRWFRYPFTNCTHCGPRLSIIQAIPYDRSHTSMAAFAMCKDCAREYLDVENRRFHAQPIACYACGPKAWLERADGKPVTSDMFSMLDDVDAVCTLLQKGEIVAIKGLGGIHLACDATNEAAVQKLRQRKHRYHKPFALMARDMTIIEQYCTPSAKEKELLTSSAAPIVLMEGKWEAREAKLTSPSPSSPPSPPSSPSPSPPPSSPSPSPPHSLTPSPPLTPSVAPGQKTLGFMLPYTPLHHLILRRMNRPIVLTSGNLSDQPQCIDNREVRLKLGGIADYFLLHNRDIVNRVDDSVVRVVGEKVQVVRRARGYAPAPITLPRGFEKTPPILAMGGELKNTFCLLREGQAILSQHVGDLEDAIAFDAYHQTLQLYLNLFEHQPEAIAIDQHPEYLSSKLGEELAAANQLRVKKIQHHHAHIAACLAENGVSIDAPAVLGVALDGLGYGADHTFWGGEFLLADYRGFKRLATFKPVAMIGGEQAIYQPWRNTYAQLLSAFNWSEIQQEYGDLSLFSFLNKQPLTLLNQLVEKGINSPLASSCGRLFDAVAAAIGICREECSYEGQAAIEMEALVDVDSLNNLKDEQSYSFSLGKLEGRGQNLAAEPLLYLETKPMWQELLTDLKGNISQSVMATKFHKGLAKAIGAMVAHLCYKHDLNQVVLTGGVFQNCVLLEQVSSYLQCRNLVVLTHSLVPSNDGGISLGQAVISAAQLKDDLTNKNSGQDRRG